MSWLARVQMRQMGAAANVAVVLALQVAGCLLSMALDAQGFSEATVVIVFVLSVLLAAALTTAPRYSLVAAVLSILCFNYFHVAPRFSLRIEGADVPGTMVVMFAVAITASYLATETRSSARASAEAKAHAQNEQLRADLLRSVSHDLRTPLTAIRGNADMLLDEAVSLDESERRRIAADIYEDAAWLSGVVENLLAVTRLEDGRVELDREAELVDDVVGEALRHVSREVAWHDLSYEPSDEMLVARMDVHLMVQVVVNLVNNAIVHTQRGSAIRVRVSRVGSCAEVRVADNGPGIAEQDKARVFESFYTSRRPVADGRRGIGLGLPLCRSIVEAHGGRIWVEDAGPCGAEFAFTLPLEEVGENGDG